MSGLKPGFAESICEKIKPLKISRSTLTNLYKTLSFQALIVSTYRFGFLLIC